MDENSPFQQQSDPNRMLSLIAAQRLARLKAQQAQESRFKQPGQDGGILDLLSRFLHPGGQSAPASPKFNREGVEDETVMK